MSQLPPDLKEKIEDEATSYELATGPVAYKAGAASLYSILLEGKAEFNTDKWENEAAFFRLDNPEISQAQMYFEGARAAWDRAQAEASLDKEEVAEELSIAKNRVNELGDQLASAASEIVKLKEEYWLASDDCYYWTPANSNKIKELEAKLAEKTRALENIRDVAKSDMGLRVPAILVILDEAFKGEKG